VDGKVLKTLEAWYLKVPGTWDELKTPAILPRESYIGEIMVT